MTKSYKNRFPRISLKVQEDLLSPPVMFPFVEFVFKIIQWSSFVAVLRFAAERAENTNLIRLSYALSLMLVLAISARVSRAIGGRIKASEDSHPLGLTLVLILSVTLASYISWQFTGVVDKLIADLVNMYIIAAHAK